MSLTLVTCWWDLESRGAEKGRRDFVALGKPVLALPMPMVIYCDPWVADTIREGRSKVDAPTHIVSIKLEDLPHFNRWSERVKSCALPGNRNIPKDSHTFIAMGWSKPGMMAEVAANPPWLTSHVGWIDLGIYHALSFEGTRPNDSLKELVTFQPKSDKVNLHILRGVGTLPQEPTYYHNIWCLTAAGFMVGSCLKVVEFASDFYDEAEQVIAGGRVSIDEDLLASLVSKTPEKYTYSYGNYCDILSNHHNLTTNADYLLWMCRDARGRGDVKFAEDLEQQIVERQQQLACPKVEIMNIKKNRSNLIKLHMIVKDESRRIRETLESVKPWIDSWSILDTGSTDGTQDIIREVLSDVPGELQERPVVTYEDTGIIDYSATRNLGLELAGTDSTFILLLNGDDILKEGEKLRSFCQVYKDTTHEAFHFNIKSESGLGFVYTRLVRSSANWRYYMPTHEAISGSKSVGGTVDGAWLLKCDDPAEVRFARWAKDQILLERWLQKHPNEHRGLFYLAQTHECLSNTGDTSERIQHLCKAIELYSKRGGLGGWLDEAYESYARAANLSERIKKPWSETQELFLQAHALAPHRAEPLTRIAQHWLGENRPSVAYIFALRASEIPLPPPGPLSPDPDLYESTIPSLLSRTAFYVGRKDVGRKAARKLYDMHSDNNSLRRNLQFYAHKLRDIGGRDYHEIDLSFSEPGWVSSTPSICVGDETKVIVRMVNYRIKPDGSYDYDGTIRTRNFLLNPYEPIESRREIQDLTKIPRTEFPVHGFEDCRLFWWRKCWWAVATVRDTTEEGTCEQALLRLDGAGDVCEMTILSRGMGHQKNWKPVVEKDTVRWVYSTDPLEIFDTGSKRPLKHAGRLLGSSQAIRLPHNWLWVDHEVSCNDQGRERIYTHRFVLASEDLVKVEAVSDPFYFEELGIEFCAGLTVINDNVVLSYSVRDASSKLVTLPLSTVIELVGK